MHRATSNCPFKFATPRSHKNILRHQFDTCGVLRVEAQSIWIIEGSNSNLLGGKKPSKIKSQPREARVTWFREGIVVDPRASSK